MKINKQTNQQTDEGAMLPLFVLFKYSGIWIVCEIANNAFFALCIVVLCFLTTEFIY